MTLDPSTLAEAVEAHKAEGERLCQAAMAHPRIQKEGAEHAETARHASMYRAK
jgi:hypothetical protein